MVILKLSTICSTSSSSLSSTRAVNLLASRMNICKVVGSTASFSSSSGNGNNNNKKSTSTAGFRPRRRTPKNLMQKPQAKARPKPSPFQTTIDPSSSSPSSSSSPNSLSKSDLESTYGPDTAAAILHLRRIKKSTGSLHPSKIFPDPETTMRMADYVTADYGSTEDLVGGRRALMDAWDDEQREEFLKGLVDFEKECEEFKISGGDGKDEEEDEGSSSEAASGSVDAVANVRGSGRGRSEDDMEDIDPNQKAFGPWSETIVRVDRVQKVQRGGTMVRYRALVIGGNLNGCAGFGVAKANAPNEACAAATRMAKRNIFFVDRYLGTGLTSSLAGRHNSCKVSLFSVNPNRGLHGHPLILEILKYFGISDCSAKSHGNRNVYNVVYATFKALMTHESLEDIALKRGKRLITLERSKKLKI